jgi:S1-C subfamily serine protease
MLVLLVLLALVVVHSQRVSRGVAERATGSESSGREDPGDERREQVILEGLLRRIDDSQRRIEQAMGDLDIASRALAIERAGFQAALDARESRLRSSLADVAAVKALARENAVRLGDVGPETEFSSERGKRLMIQPTVQLRGNGTVGSAVVVYSGPLAGDASPERYCNLALTAFHVVAEVLGNRLDREIDAVKFFFPGTDQETGALTARLIAYDKAKDIALLSLGTDLRLPGFARLQDEALLGELDIFSQACAVGCPLGSHPVATMGQITAVDKEVDGEKFWMINAPTYFGNSGGGVYSVPDCNLIGIFSMIYTYGKAKPSLVPHMGLFLPLGTIRSWLDNEGFGFVHEGAPVPAKAWKKMGYSLHNRLPEEEKSD